MSYMLETTGSQRILQHNYDMIRERLKNPTNAVKDEPINLKFKKGFKPWPPEPEIVPEPPAQPIPFFSIGTTLVLYPSSFDQPAGEREGKWPPTFLRHIKRTVAREFGISMAEIDSDQRTSKHVVPRHVAIYLVKELTILSLPEIGRRFGGRDHTTVLHAIKRMPIRLETNPHLRGVVAKLKTQFEADLAEWRNAVPVQTIPTYPT